MANAGRPRKTAARTKVAQKPGVKKPGVKKPGVKKPGVKKPGVKKLGMRKPGVKKAAAGKPAPRADYGAPIDSFFARQPANLRAVLVELRAMIEKAAPEVESSLKWGMPFFAIGGAMMCALGGHRAHVNLILSGPPGTYADPEKRLTGEGKTGRHLRLTSVDELPRAAVRRWLDAAARLARKG